VATNGAGWGITALSLPDESLREFPCPPSLKSCHDTLESSTSKAPLAFFDLPLIFFFGLPLFLF
jgi:hypothetical protein